MKIVFIIVAILVAVICVLLVLLQHYYDNYNTLKQTTYTKPYVPVFDDMIERNNIDEKLHNQEPDILKSFRGTVQAAVSTITEPPKMFSKIDNYLVTDSEVQHLLQAALGYKLSGKTDKAMRLFEHAAIIAPQNPDVLNRYGEFIEHMHNDFIVADELYSKALMYSPDHKAALINRKRTAHVVDKLDLEIFKIIDEKRDLLKMKQKSSPNYDIMKLHAYYLHIYHTVGIEGNTLSLDQLISILETGKAVQGKSIIEQNEILGLELAMKYVKLLTRFQAITVKEILGIHRRILGHADPVSSGTFRDKQVFVGKHIPPSPDDLPGLMESYVEWLNSEEAQSMHPVRYAALAHYKLVDIHPFADGNGRTSRLIMNLILLRAGYPPVLVFKQFREKYYQNLNLANEGDVRPFVRFIAHCTDHTLDMYLLGTEHNSRITHLKSATIEIEEDNRNL
ncbi:hypothetical protein FQA39_LY04776 [Lamprigera yunnana]|nr:hypothetical protein FQA39_LY04776 [Lamprigera yunnana]